MVYVRNAWYVAAWSRGLVCERPIGVQLLNEPIVIWRNTAGDLTAFEDRCIHRLAPLSLGRCEGERLRCNYHGLLYDRTGCVVEVPGLEHAPKNLRVRTYPVVERYDWVWIWMGDAPADETSIPPIGSDGPEYISARGQLDYAAAARLVTDNLLDLSHVSFLHTESFRMSETWARRQPKVTAHARSVRTERWFKNEGRSGVLDTEERVDTYFCIEYFIPGALVMSSRAYPAGTADDLKEDTPDLSRPAESYARQAITPLTDKTSRYFYTQSRRRNGQDTEYDMTVTEKAFAEDKVMIEAQQRIIDLTPHWRFRPTIADRGAALFNRLVEQLASEEGARGKP